MKAFLASLIALGPVGLNAGVNSSSLAVAGEWQKPAPAASITQRADFLCAVVVIRSSNREIERQTSAVQQSVSALRTAAERSSRFHIHDGPVQTITPLPQPGISGGVLQASVRILYPLASS